MKDTRYKEPRNFLFIKPFREFPKGFEEVFVCNYPISVVRSSVYEAKQDIEETVRGMGCNAIKEFRIKTHSNVYPKDYEVSGVPVFLGTESKTGKTKSEIKNQLKDGEKRSLPSYYITEEEAQKRHDEFVADSLLGVFYIKLPFFGSFHDFYRKLIGKPLWIRFLGCALLVHLFLLLLLCFYGLFQLLGIVFNYLF